MMPLLQSCVFEGPAAGGKFLRYVDYAAAQATASSITNAMPANARAGDFLLGAQIAQNAARNWSGDTGWTEDFDFGGSQMEIRIARLDAAAANPPVNYSFSAGASDDLASIILAFRNAQMGPLGSNFTTADANYSMSVPGITMPAPGYLIAIGASFNGQATHTGPGDMELKYSSASSSVFPKLSVWLSHVQAGATGSRTIDFAAASGTHGGCLVGVIPK